MNPGVSTQIFHREKLGPKHARAISEAGFKFVEVYTYPGHFDTHDISHAQAVRRAFNDHGVAISSLHAPFFDNRKNVPDRGRLSISHLNPRVRAAAVDSIRICMQTAHILDAHVIVSHFGDGGDKNTHAVIENLFSSIIRIEDILLHSDISVAYENIGTPTSLCGYIAYMLERYEIRNAGVCLDIGHANINEDPAMSVERADRHLIHVHASDNSGREDQHNPPFLGTVRWGRVMRALYLSGYSGGFIFEPRFQPDPIKLLNHLMQIHLRLQEMAEGRLDDSDGAQTFPQDD